MCAEVNWAKIMKGKDKCMNTQDIPDFGFSLNGKDVQFSGGLVCICNQNNCNGQAQMIPNYIVELFSAVVLVCMKLKFN